MKMLLPSEMVCFTLFLQILLSTPLSAAKPKPVELKYSCMTVIPAEHQDQRPDNVPIILLHGLGGNKESWHGVLELLALDTKKEVCAVDLRNHGESPWNSDEFDVEAITEDVKHLIDRFKAPKAIVVGHSLGGKTAVHLALNYPERVEKIVVEDIAPNGVSPGGLRDSQLYCKALLALQNDIPQGLTEIEAKKAFLKLMNKYIEKQGSTLYYNDIDFVPIKCSDGKCKLAINPVLPEVVVRDITELLTISSGCFNGPALFIYGGKSKFRVGDEERNIKMLFPNAKLVEVEGAEHTVHTFKKFTREVIKFINNK